MDYTGLWTLSMQYRTLGQVVGWWVAIRVLCIQAIQVWKHFKWMESPHWEMSCLVFLVKIQSLVACARAAKILCAGSGWTQAPNSTSLLKVVIQSDTVCLNNNGDWIIPERRAGQDFSIYKSGPFWINPFITAYRMVSVHGTIKGKLCRQIKTAPKKS